MPIKTLTNQYNGINAHLHSHWQAHGSWNNFHNRHIVDIAAQLRIKLLPMGYTATIEASLQIRRIGGNIARPRADVLIRDTQSQRQPEPVAGTATLTIGDLLTETEDTEKPYRSLAIYELTGDETPPITWIELLSPTNKGNTHDARTYRAKRRAILETGLTFIELDYLHELPPTFERLLDYTHPDDREKGAFPYRVVMLTPHPDVHSGPAVVAQFTVDDPLPLLEIPLTDGNTVRFDVGAAYDTGFREMGYGLETVDYTQLPANFDRYSQHDQRRIARRMVAVMDAHNNGQNLETGTPLPVPELSLEDALARITAAQ